MVLPFRPCSCRHNIPYHHCHWKQCRLISGVQRRGVQPFDTPFAYAGEFRVGSFELRAPIGGETIGSDLRTPKFVY